MTNIQNRMISALSKTVDLLPKLIQTNRKLVKADAYDLLDEITDILDTDVTESPEFEVAKEEPLVKAITLLTKTMDKLGTSFEHINTTLNRKL